MFISRNFKEGGGRPSLASLAARPAGLAIRGGARHKSTREDFAAYARAVACRAASAALWPEAVVQRKAESPCALEAARQKAQSRKRTVYDTSGNL